MSSTETPPEVPQPTPPTPPVVEEPGISEVSPPTPPEPAPSPGSKRSRVYDTLTPEQRSVRAKEAAAKRWSARPDWEHLPLDDALARLAELRAEVERAGAILTKRVETATRDQKTKRCFNHARCGNSIDLSSGQFAGYRTRTNPETGLLETEYACSAACFLVLCREFQHARTRPFSESTGTEGVG